VSFADRETLRWKRALQTAKDFPPAQCGAGGRQAQVDRALGIVRNRPESQRKNGPRLTPQHERGSQGPVRPSAIDDSTQESRRVVADGAACTYLTVYATGAAQSVSPVLLTERYRNCNTVPGVWPVMVVLAWSVDDRSIQVLPSVEYCQS
jgi:hypothetical protein